MPQAYNMSISGDGSIVSGQSSPAMQHMNVVSKCGVVLCAVGVVLFLAGFGGHDWGTKGPYNAGLWEACSTGEDAKCCSTQDPYDWQITSAGLEIAGLVLCATTLTFVGLYLFYLGEQWLRRVNVAFIGSAALSGVLIIAGCIVWSDNKNELMISPATGQFIELDLDVSFFLAVIGGSVQLLASGAWLIGLFMR